MNRKETAEEILRVFSSRSGQKLSPDDIRKKLKDSYPDITGALEDLTEQGVLWPVRKGRYILAEELGIARGRIRARPGGSGFVITDADERIQINKNDMGNVLDGDTVLVRRLEPILSGDQYRGRIERVLSRHRSGISGVTRRAGSGWVICPVNPVLPDRIHLLTDGQDVEAGRIVFAELEYSGRKITAVLRRTIGDPSSPAALMDSVVADSGFQTSFCEELLEEAERVSAMPITISNEREDLRDVLTITIDPVDARDFDDAVSLETSDDGDFILGVHIADVAAYVPPGSLLDTEARLRGTSVYLPDRVIPMLPEVLSNGSCSLRPGEDRYARSVIITFDHTGRRKDFTIIRSVIRSRYRLSYEEALGILEGTLPTEFPLSDLIVRLGRLSELLDDDRKKRGALDLGSSEFRTEFGSDGWPDGFRRVPDDSAHRMIENFMIEANRAVADHCGWVPLQVLYRIHGDPAPESVERLGMILSRLGIQVPGRITRQGDLTRLLDSLQDSPALPLAREAVLRSLQKAVYSPSNEGHYGLALNSYLHFTSPIRRYPDLIVHQVLTCYESGIDVKTETGIRELALATSSSERMAESAEREAVKLMGLLYLSRHKGAGFPGVISGVKEFGVFVRLLELPAEGLIPVWVLKKSGCHFPEVFREGDGVTVKVVDADPLTRSLTLSPLDVPERK